MSEMAELENAGQGRVICLRLYGALNRAHKREAGACHVLHISYDSARLAFLSQLPVSQPVSLTRHLICGQKPRVLLLSLIFRD